MEKSQTTIFLEQVQYVQKVIDNPKNKKKHIPYIKRVIQLLDDRWCFDGGMYNLSNCKIVYPLYDNLKKLNLQ